MLFRNLLDAFTGKTEPIQEKEPDKILEYQNFVLSRMSPKSLVSLEAKLGLIGLGLSGEAGECSDLVKKVLYHEMEFDDKVKQKLINELGDVMFYAAFAAVVLETDLYKVMQANVEKLKERYKSGKFTVQEFLDKEKKKDEQS